MKVTLNFDACSRTHFSRTYPCVCPSAQGLHHPFRHYWGMTNVPPMSTHLCVYRVKTDLSYVSKLLVLEKRCRTHVSRGEQNMPKIELTDWTCFSIGQFYGKHDIWKIKWEDSNIWLHDQWHVVYVIVNSRVMLSFTNIYLRKQHNYKYEMLILKLNWNVWTLMILKSTNRLNVHLSILTYHKLTIHETLRRHYLP